MSIESFETHKYLKQGYVYWSLGRFDEALQTFQAAIDEDRSDKEAIRARKSLALDRDMPGDALASLQKLLPGQPIYALRVAQLLCAEDHVGEALSLCEQIIKDYPEYLPAYATLVILYESLELREKATLCCVGMPLIAGSVAYIWQHAMELRRLGRRKEALILFEHLITIAPSAPEGYVGKGYIRYDDNDNDEALSLMNQACALDSRHPAAHTARAFVLLGMNRDSDALADCEIALRNDPEHLWAYNNKGRALLKLKRYEEALPCFDFVIAQKPTTFIAHHMLKTVGLLLVHRDEEAWQTFANFMGGRTTLSCYYTLLHFLSEHTLPRATDKVFEMLRQADAGNFSIYKYEARLAFKQQRFWRALIVYLHYQFLVNTAPSRIVSMRSPRREKALLKRLLKQVDAGPMPQLTADQLPAEAQGDTLPAKNLRAVKPATREAVSRYALYSGLGHPVGLYPPRRAKGCKNALISALVLFVLFFLFILAPDEWRLWLFYGMMMTIVGFVISITEPYKQNTRVYVCERGFVYLWENDGMAISWDSIQKIVLEPRTSMQVSTAYNCMIVCEDGAWAEWIHSNFEHFPALVEHVEQKVSDYNLPHIQAALEHGSSVKFGNVVLAPNGIHLDQEGAKTIVWEDIITVEIKNGKVFLRVKGQQEVVYLTTVKEVPLLKTLVNLIELRSTPQAQSIL